MRFLVLAPQTATNSLGRALSVIEILHRLGDAALCAYDTGPLWPGAEGTTFGIERFRSFGELSALVGGRIGEAEVPLTIVAIKPFPRTLGWAAQLRGDLGDSVRLIADIDDADVFLQRAWRRRQPPLTRLRRSLSERREPDLHTPRNIAGTLRRCLGQAQALFLSSWALEAVVPRFDGPVFRVPHARPSSSYLVPTPSDRLRLGFFGTPRAHKGFDRLLALLPALPAAELHLLEGTRLPAGAEKAHAEQLVMHPRTGADALGRAFADVDVVVLPQDPTTTDGRLQLPAKLLDAQRFGRPVVATATPPIVELGGPGLLPVAGWNDFDEGLRALEALSDPALRDRLGRAANSHFNTAHSAEAQAVALRPRLAALLCPKPEACP